MVECIGEIRGIPIYYDKSLNRNDFMIGRRSCEAEMQFVLGKSTDLSKYEVVINHYIKFKNDDN